MSTSKKILYNILAILLPLLLIEGLGRAYYAVKEKRPIDLIFPFGQKVDAPSIVKQDVTVFNKGKINEYQKYNPGKHWDKRGHFYTYNSSGFHDREFTVEKPANTYRILTFGSSSTAMESVPDGKTWSDQLEKKLNERLPKNSDRKYQVYNFGMGGFVARQIYYLLKEEGLAYKPDMIIFYSIHTNTGFRDAQINIRSKMGLFRARSLIWLYANSLPTRRIFDNLMEKQKARLLADKNGEDLRVQAKESYDRYVIMILDLCAANGIRPVLVPEPRGSRLFTDYGKYLSMSDQELIDLSVGSEKYEEQEKFNFSDFLFYNHMMLANHLFRIGQDRGVTVVNPYPRWAQELKKQNNVFLDFVHPTAYGCEVLADEIAKAIEK